MTALSQWTRSLVWITLMALILTAWSRMFWMYCQVAPMMINLGGTPEGLTLATWKIRALLLAGGGAYLWLGIATLRYGLHFARKMRRNLLFPVTAPAAMLRPSKIS